MKLSTGTSWRSVAQPRSRGHTTAPGGDVRCVVTIHPMSLNGFQNNNIPLWSDCALKGMQARFAPGYQPSVHLNRFHTVMYCLPRVDIRFSVISFFIGLISCHFYV